MVRDGQDTEGQLMRLVEYDGGSLVDMTACTLTEHDPVTDVAIVSKKQACPYGYKLVRQDFCPLALSFDVSSYLTVSLQQIYLGTRVTYMLRLCGLCQATVAQTL